MVISDGTSDLAESKSYECVSIGAAQSWAKVRSPTLDFPGVRRLLIGYSQRSEDAHAPPDSPAAAFALARDSVGDVSAFMHGSRDGGSVLPVWVDATVAVTHRRRHVAEQTPALRRYVSLEHQ